MDLAADRIEFCENIPPRYELCPEVRIRYAVARPFWRAEAPVVTAYESSVEQQFMHFAENWKNSTGGFSSITRRYAHPTYQKILGMGPAIIPFILRELQRRPDWWFEALKALTEDDPAKATGTFEQARSAWIQWGKQRNLFSLPTRPRTLPGGDPLLTGGSSSKDPDLERLLFRY
jgi:hypothetical protein